MLTPLVLLRRSFAYAFLEVLIDVLNTLYRPSILFEAVTLRNTLFPYLDERIL